MVLILVIGHFVIVYLRKIVKKALESRGHFDQSFVKFVDKALNIDVRVVSMPCQEIFDAQTDNYKNSVINKEIPTFSLELSSDLSFYKYIGVGETIEDLQKFDSDQFVNALFATLPQVLSLFRAEQAHKNYPLMPFLAISFPKDHYSGQYCSGDSLPTTCIFCRDSST